MIPSAWAAFAWIAPSRVVQMMMMVVEVSCLLFELAPGDPHEPYNFSPLTSVPFPFLSSPQSKVQNFSEVYQDFTSVRQTSRPPILRRKIAFESSRVCSVPPPSSISHEQLELGGHRRPDIDTEANEIAWAPPDDLALVLKSWRFPPFASLAITTCGSSRQFRPR